MMSRDMFHGSMEDTPTTDPHDVKYEHDNAGVPPADFLRGAVNENRRIDGLAPLSAEGQEILERSRLRLVAELFNMPETLKCLGQLKDAQRNVATKTDIVVALGQSKDARMSGCNPSISVTDTLRAKFDERQRCIDIVDGVRFAAPGGDVYGHGWNDAVDRCVGLLRGDGDSE